MKEFCSNFKKIYKVSINAYNQNLKLGTILVVHHLLYILQDLYVRL